MTSFQYHVNPECRPWSWIASFHELAKNPSVYSTQIIIEGVCLPSDVDSLFLFSFVASVFEVLYPYWAELWVTHWVEVHQPILASDRVEPISLCFKGVSESFPRQTATIYGVSDHRRGSAVQHNVQKRLSWYTCYASQTLWANSVGPVCIFYVLSLLDWRDKKVRNLVLSSRFTLFGDRQK